MAVFRYNGGGDWAQVRTIWRYNGGGDWAQVKSVWRYNGGGDWGRVFGSSAIPIPSIPNVQTEGLVFKFNDGFETIDSPYNGSQMFAIRGGWTEDPNKFTITIQERAPGGSWTAVKNQDNTDAIYTRTYADYLTSDDYDRFLSNANAANRPTISKPRTRQGYEFRAKWDVENPTGFTNSVTSTAIKPRMAFEVSSFTISNLTTNGATFSWAFSPIFGNTGAIDTTLDIYSQTINIYDSTYTNLILSQPVTVGTTSYVLSNVLLQGNTQYTAELEVIGQDGFATSADPTAEYAVDTFTTLLTLGAFNLTNVQKYTPNTNGSTSGRTITVNIGQSSNATRYEVQIQGQFAKVGGSYDIDNPSTSGWVTLQSFAASPYVQESSRSGGVLTYTRVNLADYRNYRVTARSSTSASSAYFAFSDGGTESFLTYINASGTAPSAPVISNIATATDAGGAYVTFTNSISSKGSNNTEYIEYSLNNGSTWQISNTSAVNPIYTGFINDVTGKLYVTAGSTVNLRIRYTNQDGFTGSQSNLLTITAAAIPGDPTSLIVRSFANNQVTVFFTSGANTGSVNASLERYGFVGGIEQTEYYENYVNVSSNTAAKVLVGNTSSNIDLYDVFLRAYSQANKAGGFGPLVSGSNIVPGGQHAMSISNFAAPNRTSSSLTITWSGSGSVNKYRARLYRTSNNSLIEDKGYTLTSGEATFNNLDSNVAYYVIVNPRYEYTSTVFEDGTQGQSGNFSTLANLTPPTPGTATYNTGTGQFSVTFSGGTGPWYQGWYVVNDSTRPTVSVFDSGTATQTSPMRWTLTPAGTPVTYYFWMRSSLASDTNTFDNASVWSTTSATYTTSAPTGGSAYLGNSGGTSISTITRGGIIYLWRTDATGNPTPTASWVWQRNDGGTGGNTFRTVQTGGTSYTTTSADESYSIRAVVTWSNSIGTAQTVNTGSVSVTAPVSAPTNATIPTLSPTSISVGTELSAGIGTWNNSPTSYDIRIYRGTAGVLTSETLVASRTGSSTANLTYTITQADYDSGQRYFRTYVNASNAGGSSGFIAGQERGPTSLPVSIPTNTSQPSLTGNLSVGSIVTFTVGTWTGSPTSYDLRLYRGTQFVSSGETLVKSAGNTSQSTYTITQADFNSGQRYLRAFASATNSAGTSSLVAGQEIGPITAGSGGSAPATPTNVTLSGSGSVGFSTVTGADTYTIEFYTAQSSTGLNAAGPYTQSTLSPPYQLVTPYASPNNWARVRVRANNSNGSSAYSAWVPSETSYT